MRVARTQQTRRVFVFEGRVGRRRDLPDYARLEADTPALNGAAREKYCHGQVVADGFIAMTMAEMANFRLFA